MISRNEKPNALHGKSSNSGLLYSSPSRASFRPPIIRPYAKTRSQVPVSPSLFAKHPYIPALTFSQRLFIILKVYQRYFSCAPAHSPDGLQRSLNPFAHSRETVAGFALTVKRAYRHRTESAILSFFYSPALSCSLPTYVI